jgi:hypothetical protein
MKQVLKRLIEGGLRKLGNSAVDYDRIIREVHRNVAADQERALGELKASLAADYERVSHHLQALQTGGVDQGVQNLLALRYQEMLHHRLPLPRLADVEFRAFSQNGEDGILLYLFALLGTTNKKCVEICAGDGIECNTANLIINHGWTGLLVDGNEANVAQGRRFYAECRDTFIRPPTFVHSWVSAENVNDLLRQHDFTGDIDLFSLDIDGVDYWLWKALEVIRPRAVVLEYHYAFGPDRAVTVPYRPDFCLDFSKQPYYCGASLAAFVKLGRQKGYRLIGCQRGRFNAFFLRAGVGEELFPEIDAAECLKDYDHPWDWGGREWVEV